MINGEPDRTPVRRVCLVVMWTMSQHHLVPYWPASAVVDSIGMDDMVSITNWHHGEQLHPHYCGCDRFSGEAGDCGSVDRFSCCLDIGS